MLQQHVAQRMRTHGFPPAVTTPTLREAVSTVMDSAPSPADTPEQSPDLAHRFRDRFESLVPDIQRRWPEVTQQALEATRGSFDEVVQLLSEHSDRAGNVVSIQLEELLHQAGDRTKHLADSLDPWRSNWSISWMSSTKPCGPRSRNPCVSVRYWPWRSRPVLVCWWAP